MANISQIKLPNGSVYDIYDASALHNINIVQALVFKGSLKDEATIKALTNANAGAVYHATTEGTEWLCTEDISGTANASAWEELGNPLVNSHKHEVSVAVTGTNQASTVTGTVEVPTVSTGALYTKATASGTSLNTETGDFLTSYTGDRVTLMTDSITGVNGSITANAVSEVSSSKLNTTTITGVGKPETVINSVEGNLETISPVSILGVQPNSTITASKATQGTAVSVAKAGSQVTIPNVTSNNPVTASKVTLGNPLEASSVTSASGTAASWGASVNDGVLEFSWTTNTPTVVSVSSVSIPNVTKVDPVAASKVTLGDTISVIPAVANGTITPYSFTDVTVPVAATSSTSVAALANEINLVKSISTTTVDVATSASNSTTVATGGISSGGTGGSIITGVSTTPVTIPKAATEASTFVTGLEDGGTTVLVGLGDSNTAEALISASVSTQPTITLDTKTSSATGYVKTGNTITTGAAQVNLVNGTAAAQQWTQASGSGITGGPEAL